MLKNILSAADCAACRLCCTFERYELADTPVIPYEMSVSLKELFPGLEFVPKGNCRLFRMKETGDGTFPCPMLTGTGCVLGDSKPFDCRIWPLRVMEFRGRIVITIDILCEKMYQKSLKTLITELDGGLADIIFEEAKKYPDIVRDYTEGFPILKTGGYFGED